MGQKTNPVGFRLLYKKSWSNPSFYDFYNYKYIWNLDNNIIKFIKGFLSYINIPNNKIILRRVQDNIFISIIFYAQYLNFLNSDIFTEKQRLKKKQIDFLKVKKLPSFRMRSIQFRKRKTKRNLFFNSLNIFKLDRTKTSPLLMDKPLQGSFNSKNLLNNIKSLKLKDFSVSIIPVGLLNYSNKSLIKSKLFIIYVNLIYIKKIKTLINNFNNLQFFFLINYIRKIFIKTNNGKSLSHNKITSNLFVKSGKIVKSFEGISIKRLLTLFVNKISGINNVHINFIKLQNPSRKSLKYFYRLKKNVRARGELRSSLNMIFLILYQSMLLKSPEIFGNHISFLIKTNIKGVRQIFMLLTRLLPYFSRLMNYKGIRIQLKGRINGSKRTRVHKAQYGNIPLSTVSKNIYYSFNKVMTIHGVYSLKIWYYI